MKLSNLFWNLLGIMVLSACSNSDMTENDLSETNVDARFMSVDITQVISPEIFMKKGKVLKMM